MKTPQEEILDAFFARLRARSDFEGVDLPTLRGVLGCGTKPRADDVVTLLSTTSATPPVADHDPD